jgi:hypothetical protein
VTPPYIFAGSNTDKCHHERSVAILYSNWIAAHTPGARTDAQSPAISSLSTNLAFCKYISIQKIWQDESACTMEQIYNGCL